MNMVRSRASFSNLDGSAASDINSQPAGLLAIFVTDTLSPHDAEQVLQGVYTSRLHEKILSHLQEFRHIQEKKRRGAVSPLPIWRLRRVHAFVDANIQERISLQALASVAGLSRMHFAAQFRRATGMRPHDYLVRKRVAAAQAMIRESRSSIVDVAMSVGFQTQSHFTTVFKKIIGVTPNRFRKLQAGAPQLAPSAAE